MGTSPFARVRLASPPEISIITIESISRLILTDQ